MLFCTVDYDNNHTRRNKDECTEKDVKIRVGIIGCGGIANGKHMPSLAKVAEVEMVAFVI